MSLPLRAGYAPMKFSLLPSPLTSFRWSAGALSRVEQVTAGKFGDLVASILRIASEQSQTTALLALERPLRVCTQWTPMDLVVMSQCDKVRQMSSVMATATQAALNAIHLQRIVLLAQSHARRRGHEAFTT